MAGKVTIKDLGERILHVRYHEFGTKTCFLPRTFRQKHIYARDDDDLVLDRVTPTLRSDWKGNDAEWKVFRMLQTQMTDGFVIRSFKYNKAIHQRVRRRQPELANKIKKQFPDEPDSILSFELDFLIFSQSKGLFIGEVKAVDNYSATFQIEEAENACLKRQRFFESVLEMCNVSDPEVAIQKVVFLPNFVDAYEGKYQFTYVVGCPDRWWEALPIADRKLPEQILHYLLGIYAASNKTVDDPVEETDLSTITKSIGDIILQQSHLNSKYSDHLLLEEDFIGDAKIYLNKQQREIWDSDLKWLIIHGPAGTGKSLLLKYKAYERAAKGEKTRLIVPSGLKKKYCEEKFPQITENLEIMSHEEVSTVEPISLCDRDANVFIDEFSHLTILENGNRKFDFTRYFSHESCHRCIDTMEAKCRWFAYDDFQFVGTMAADICTFPAFKQRLLRDVDVALQHGFQLKTLSSCLRYTKEVWDDINRLSGHDSRCGSMLSGPPIIRFAFMKHFRRDVKLESEFMLFVADKLLENLQTLVSWAEVEPIALFCTDDIYRKIEERFKEKADKIDFHRLFQFISNSQIISMEYHSVVHVYTSSIVRDLDAIVSRSRRMHIRMETLIRNIYLVRSRVKVNLMTFEIISDNFGEICCNPGMHRLVSSSSRETDESFANLEYSCNSWLLHFEESLRREQVMELERFMLDCAADLPSVLERHYSAKISDLVSDLPWTFPIIGIRHMNIQFGGISATRNVGQQVFHGSYIRECCEHLHNLMQSYAITYDSRTAFIEELTDVKGIFSQCSPWEACLRTAAESFLIATICSDDLNQLIEKICHVLEKTAVMYTSDEIVSEHCFNDLQETYLPENRPISPVLEEEIRRKGLILQVFLEKCNDNPLGSRIPKISIAALHIINLMYLDFIAKLCDRPVQLHKASHDAPLIDASYCFRIKQILEMGTELDKLVDSETATFPMGKSFHSHLSHWANPCCPNCEITKLVTVVSDEELTLRRRCSAFLLLDLLISTKHLFLRATEINRPDLMCGSIHDSILKTLMNRLTRTDAALKSEPTVLKCMVKYMREKFRNSSFYHHVKCISEICKSDSFATQAEFDVIVSVIYLVIRSSWLLCKVNPFEDYDLYLKEISDKSSSS